MSNSLLLSLQKFSVHDGPGIRTTVFFKGCPLRCLWCHNPESQNFKMDLMHDAEKCTGCGICKVRCPQQAVKSLSGKSITDRDQCIACGECVDYCLSSARAIAGRRFSIPEIVAEIEKDHIFYEQSGGGVTFSGGETMSHIAEVEELSRICKSRGIHVTIDTCGHAPQDSFRRMLPHADLFLYDLKHMDSKIHHRYTGQDNRLILDNLRYLSASGASIFLRLPLIEGINADDFHIYSVLEFLHKLNILQVNLLPYHNIGANKQLRLGRLTGNPSLAAPSPDRLESIQRRFESAGHITCIGG